MSESRFITTSIPYVNGDPHIGYGLELLYADVLARYLRRAGFNVRFTIGTDEHGQKVARAAEKMKRTPQQHVNELSRAFTKAADVLDISYTDVIRTADERHKRGAQKMWQMIAQAGYIEKRQYEGLYCVGCEAFKTPKDLVDGVCPIHKVVPELIQEENYFFKLSQFQDRLEEYYKAHPDFVVPDHRFNEMQSIVFDGLEDVSISRDVRKLSWGVPVPGDDTQVMYVWFEALMNYINVVGFGENQAEFAEWWQHSFHIVGKDINRFHSVMWPAMLMAAGLPMPQQVAVHGFISVDGQKMSKSIGNVIDPVQLVHEYGLEPVRYFLLREIPFGGDGDFSYGRLRERYAADLANGLGNLVSRVTNMVEKYFDGQVEAAPHTENYGQHETTVYNVLMQQFEFHKALDVVWQVIGESDAYVEANKPWELAKTDQAKLRSVLAHLVFALQLISDWLVPFMPDTAEKINTALGQGRITKVQPLFPRLEE